MDDYLLLITVFGFYVEHELKGSDCFFYSPRQCHGCICSDTLIIEAQGGAYEPRR